MHISLIRKLQRANQIPEKNATFVVLELCMAELVIAKGSFKEPAIPAHLR